MKPQLYRRYNKSMENLDLFFDIMHIVIVIMKTNDPAKKKEHKKHLYRLLKNI
jgi:hypothetical protein